MLCVCQIIDLFNYSWKDLVLPAAVINLLSFPGRTTVQDNWSHSTKARKHGKLTGSAAMFSQCFHFTAKSLCVCVRVSIQAHQTVQASAQKVHRTHLHGGDLGHIDWRAQVQVQQVTQQVTLAGDHMRLVHGSHRPAAHWALTCVNAVIGENSSTGKGHFKKLITNRNVLKFNTVLRQLEEHNVL